MGLLDGDLKAVFGGVFGPLLLDATLHKVSLTRDAGDTITPASADHAVKAMVDAYSDTFRAAAGIPATDVRLIVLQIGVPVAPNTDDQITIRGKRYAIASVDEDPAQASWTMRGSPV